MQEEHARALIRAVNAYPDIPVDELTHKVVFEDVGMAKELIADCNGDDPGSIHAFLKDTFAPKVTVTVKEDVCTVPGCTHDLFKDNFFADYVDRIPA